MKKAGRSFITLTIILASAPFASALMLKLSPNSSWLAFVGWSILFVAAAPVALVLGHTIGSGQLHGVVAPPRER